MKVKLSILIIALTCAEVLCATTFSGECGVNLKWSINTEDSVLTITGTGRMSDWNWRQAPWYEDKDSVK